MKISCDVDCSPEELRRFVGLPDLSPVHEAYVARMTKAAGEGLSADAVSEMMRAWGPMGEAGGQMWKTLAQQIMGAATPKP